MCASMFFLYRKSSAFHKERGGGLSGGTRGLWTTWEPGRGPAVLAEDGHRLTVADSSLSTLNLPGQLLLWSNTYG